MIKELRKLESIFANDLTQSVEDRIKERRKPKLSTLLAYLENSRFLDVSMMLDRVLQYANKKDITTLAKDIYIRLFPEEQPLMPHTETGEEESLATADQV